MPSLHRPPDPTKQCCVCRDSGIWIVNSRNWTAQTRRPAPISSLLFLTRRRCIAGSAPSTPCTMDSSALETRSRRARRNQYDAAGAFSCARRRSDVTRCNDIEMITYGLLCVIRNHPIQPEVHNVSQRRQKRAKPRRPLVMIRRVVPGIYWRTGRRTDRQTRSSQYSVPLASFRLFTLNFTTSFATAASINCSYSPKYSLICFVDLPLLGCIAMRSIRCGLLPHM